MNLKQALERAILKVGGIRALSRELRWGLGSLADAQKGGRPIPPLRAAQIAQLLGMNEVEATLQALADQAKGDDVQFWLDLIELYRRDPKTPGER